MVQEDEVRKQFSQRLALACNNAGVKHRGRGIILAKALKVTPKAVSKWLAGEALPREGKIRDLAKYLNVSLAWLQLGVGDLKSTNNDNLLNYTNNSNPARINANVNSDGFPIDKLLAVGVTAWDTGTPLADDELEIPYYSDIETGAKAGCCHDNNCNCLMIRFSKSVLNKANALQQNVFCFTAPDSSMDPVLPEGTTIAVDTGNKKIQEGKLYVINHGGLYRIKQIYLLPYNMLRIRSFNTNYPDEDIKSDDVIIIGKVFWSASTWN